MIQAIRQPLTLDEFIAQYGENDRWELIDGELIDMEPTGPREQVAAFIGRKLNVEIDRSGFPFFIPFRCLINALGTSTIFRPDVIVLDQTALGNEPLWQREPVITLGSSIKVVIDVVSTNWQNNYARKAEDYETLGIPEYWIVDYLGFGGKKFIGFPKQPTLSIYQLVNGEYQVQQFRGNRTIESHVFPELQLSLNQILASLKGQVE